ANECEFRTHQDTELSRPHPQSYPVLVFAEVVPEARECALEWSDRIARSFKPSRTRCSCKLSRYSRLDPSIPVPVAIMRAVASSSRSTHRVQPLSAIDAKASHWPCGA